VEEQTGRFDLLDTGIKVEHIIEVDDDYEMFVAEFVRLPVNHDFLRIFSSPQEIVDILRVLGIAASRYDIRIMNERRTDPTIYSNPVEWQRIMKEYEMFKSRLATDRAYDVDEFEHVDHMAGIEKCLKLLHSPPPSRRGDDIALSLPSKIASRASHLA